MSNGANSFLHLSVCWVTFFVVACFRFFQENNSNISVYWYCLYSRLF